MGMGKAISFALACSAFACGSGDDGKAESGPKPSECSPSDRTGLYAVVYTQTSGDCGQLAPQEQRFSAGYLDPVPANCVLLSDKWSEDYCELTRSMRCDNNYGAGNVLDVTISTTVQTDDLGASWSGTMTLSRQSKGVAPPCEGTYSVNATRQGL